MQLSSDLPARCVRHYFKIRGVKAGFALLYDGIRHTLITHGRTIRYVYTRGAFLSLFLIRSLFFRPYLPGEVARLIVARSTIRSRENEQRFIAAMGASLQPAGSFSRPERGRGYLTSKINTYSRDFITNGHHTMHGRDSAGITRVIWAKRRRGGSCERASSGWSSKNIWQKFDPRRDSSNKPLVAGWIGVWLRVALNEAYGF